MLVWLISRADDGLSDDIGDSSPIMLPPPNLGNLFEIENHMRAANATPGGREALAKFVLAEKYVLKLIPLVEEAEDLESASDLHRLCSIMKMLILLNDNSIVEYVVTDEVILGVVGALECRLARIYRPASTDIMQMIRISHCIKLTTDNTSLMNQNSRRLSRSKTRTYGNEFTTHTDYST